MPMHISFRNHRGSKTVSGLHSFVLGHSGIGILMKEVKMKQVSRWWGKRRFFFLIMGIALILCLNAKTVMVKASARQGHSAQPKTRVAAYTLFAPLNSTDTYLMDDDGQLVHSWPAGYRPANAVYLLDNGLLLHTGKTQNKTFDAGGAGGMVQLIDWEGNVAWEYAYAGDTHLQHHDARMLPNGNILMIAWQYKTALEAQAQGRNPDLLEDGALWPDSIIEVAPTGPATGRIVWEWHVWDHLIQDYDPQKKNYGVVADHPGRIDINFTMNGHADWTHFNSIDYNPALDQILISVHNFSEIWVIDHSTTTAQAASARGGNSGRGGELLYRWGNPEAYGAGTSFDQRLFHQHDAEWIRPGLPGQGNILIFNNGLGRPGGDYSSIEEITPPVDNLGTYAYSQGSAYGPQTVVWQYTARTPTRFYATNISGQQRLANGNTLICSGPQGYFFEVTPAGQTVWEYEYGDAVFKIERYPLDYPGFLQTSEAPIYPEPGPDDGDETGGSAAEGLSFPIVDTGQTQFFDDYQLIEAPNQGDAFYGQDAGIKGLEPSYTQSADGLTVHDNVTGLTWTQSPDINNDGAIDVDDKLGFEAAQSYAQILNQQNFAGFNDWRLPTIKELYSLMNFSGTDPMQMYGGTSRLIPFIDTDYFDFAYGDTNAGERTIDAQFWSSNSYAGTVFNGQAAAFGLNLADGRIKGYPTGGRVAKVNYLYFVRGNPDYGINAFNDNGDGTVTDKATGLMWAKDDSKQGMVWKTALSWVQQKNSDAYLGYTDWRLPNAKEMQSIVNYSRAPDATDSAAIDPVFNITQIINENMAIDYPWFWTGTTHVRSDGTGSSGVYICFGRAMGYMNGTWMDVHGAGAQRSDGKDGDFTRFTYVEDGYYFGMSPQGDAYRGYNYVRLVRDADD